MNLIRHNENFQLLVQVKMRLKQFQRHFSLETSNWKKSDCKVVEAQLSGDLLLDLHNQAEFHDNKISETPQDFFSSSSELT